MGSRRLPHPDSSGAPNSTSPRKWGEMKARTIAQLLPSPGTLARGRGVAGALGADDAAVFYLNSRAASRTLVVAGN